MAASWIAIDWDQDQFHILCAQPARRGAQVTKAVTWTHPEPFTPSTAERVGKALRDFLKDEKVAPAPVIVGLGRDRILLKELRFPPIAGHEEAALVRFQTAKELTESVEQYAIDYVHMNAPSKDGERQIATVAARRDIVAMLHTLCQAAGLKLHAVTPRVFGVASALQQAVLPGPSPLAAGKRSVVLTLGQRWAELSFYHGERLVQAQALAKGTLLANEVKRNIAVFLAQHAVDVDVTGPESLYVFGDDPATIQALQTGLAIPIVALDPLGPETATLSHTKNPDAFAGALGLAVLWTNAKEAPVNLASPKKQQPPTSISRQRGMFYGAAAAVVLVLVMGSMYAVLAREKSALQKLVAEKNQKQADFDKVAQERADIEAYKEWEQTTIPWLDEMYDLAARFPNKPGLRLNQFSAATTSKKNAKDGYVGKIALTGVTPKGKDAYVSQLVQSMARDPHVRAQIIRMKRPADATAPIEFQMTIEVKKQPADKYDTRLVVTRPPPPPGEEAPAMLEEDEGDAP